MDYIREVEEALNEMEWGEVVSTLEAAVMELLAETPLPPVTPPPPPAPAPFMAAQPHQVRSRLTIFNVCYMLSVEHGCVCFVHVL